MWPPGGVYFAALFSRLSMTCDSRARSPSTRMGCAGSSSSRLWRRGVEEGAAGLDGLLHDLARVHGFHAQRDLAARDAADVQQVVHEPRQLRRLPVDDVARVHGRPARRSPMACSRSMALRMGASGLRSSCPSMARNSSTCWRDASRSTTRLRSVMSRVTLAKPSGSPVASRSEVSTVCAQNA
jgi:hypothetical protein